MLRILNICALLLISSKACMCEDYVVDKTELVLAFMVHRHGDRTPVESSLTFSPDKDLVIAKSSKYGYGQLTEKGKNRSYKLGKTIRGRYGAYLSNKYSKSEILIRSTDSTRAKMTILTALSAIYPALEDNWSKEINWTPVPYTTVRAKYDHMLATLNCPAIKEQTVIEESNMDSYLPLMQEISDTIGLDVSKDPGLLYILYDIFVSQMSMGVPLPENLDARLPEIREGAALAIDNYLGNKKTLPLYSGVQLHEFFVEVDKILSGQDVPRIQIYSAHDLNVFTFSAITNIKPRLEVPKYAALYSLELRRDVQNGQYIIVPVYFEDPGADLAYLQVDGCEGFCGIDRFRELTSGFTMNETEWRTACEFSEDLEFDLSSID